MRMPAAPGTGRPTMYLPGLVGAPFSPIDSTLKRARRTAPAAVKMNDATRPTVVRLPERPLVDEHRRRDAEAR